MKSKTISFRCPENLYKEMEILCEHNQVDRSRFIVRALQSMFAGLARQGICEEGETQAPPATEEN